MRESCRQLSFEKTHASVWKDKTKTKQRNFSTLCLSPMSFCHCCPGTEGLCPTTARMACERSTWPRWRNALEKLLGGCTSSPLMGSWSWSRATTPPSSYWWKRCGLSKTSSVWQDWCSFPLLFRLLRRKYQSRGTMKWWMVLRLMRLKELKRIEGYSDTYKQVILGFWVTPKVWLSCLSVMMLMPKKDRSGRKIYFLH